MLNSIQVFEVQLSTCIFTNVEDKVHEVVVTERLDFFFEEVAQKFVSSVFLRSTLD